MERDCQVKLKMALINRLTLVTTLLSILLSTAHANINEEVRLPGNMAISDESDTTDCHRSWNTSVSVTIFISTYGNDSSDCVCGKTTKPCQSFQYAYFLATNILSNATENITFSFIEDVFIWSDPVFINKPVPSLRRLTIESASRQGTTIVAKNPNAVIWVGCNETNDYNPCITYGLTIEDIIFTKFGSNYPAVLVVFTIPWLKIDNCEFINNNCSGVNLLETPVTLIRSRFIQNYGTANFEKQHNNLTFGFPMSNTSNGGALALIFWSKYEKTVTIKNCEFRHNKAAENLLMPFIAHTLGDIAFPRIGGGVLLLFMKNCSKKSVLISNSNFYKNGAYSGGAIAILAEGFAGINTIALESSTFIKNVAKSSSGAILFANWDFSMEHQLAINNCSFIGNEARFAGAIKYLLNNLHQQRNVSHLLIIKNSEINSNLAVTGAAAHFILGSRQRYFASAVHIVNTTFSQNEITTAKNDSSSRSQYGGIILTHKIDITFTGNNTIKANRGGCGLYASNSDINVNGTLIFADNVTPSSGGAMTLADTSHLIMYPRSHLKYERNHAGTKGGALAIFAVGMPALTYVLNPFCFLQYSERNLPYSQWDTKLEFIKNSAEVKGAAIFINSLSACLWSEDPPHNSFSKALKWNTKFVYRENFVNDMYGILTGYSNDSLYDVDIATDTNNLELEESKEISLAPGETVHLNLQSFDELDSPTYSVPFAQPVALTKHGNLVESEIELPYKYFVLDPFGKSKAIALYYEINRENYPSNQSLLHEIQFFDTRSSFVTKATLRLNLSNCRAGFKFNGKTCVCDRNNTFIKSCQGTKVYLKNGIWATDDNGDLKGHYCPDNYCKCTQVDPKVSCQFDFKNPDMQCADGRAGPLCGRCPKSRCISLYDGSCKKCSKRIVEHGKGGFAFLVISVAIVAVIVVYLNPSFSTSLRGPVFYIQMLPYIFTTNRGKLGFFVRGAASLIALGGTSGLPIPGCLGNDWNRLEIIALTYIFAAAILIILLFTYIMSRCYVLNFVRDSPFEAFWILLIATYCFFSETSLIFFRCTKIGGDNKFFYDGTVTCYKGLHLVMTIVAVVVLVFFVILPPLAVLLMCYGVINIPLQVIDAFTKGLRDEYRWWWAADLCRRFAYIAVFVFINLKGVRQVAYIIMSNFILAVHCFCRPYRSNWANISEAFILLSMSMIATLQLADTEGDGYLIASVIVISNYVYMISIFAHKLFFFARARLRKRFPFFFKRMKDETAIQASQRSQTPERVEGNSS